MHRQNTPDAPSVRADGWQTLRGNVHRTGYTPVVLQPACSVSWVRHFDGERISTCVEPIVWRDRLFIGTHNGNLYALDARTGEPQWRFHIQGAFLHSPACAQDLVLAGNTDGRLYALDAGSGALRWSVDGGQGGFSASPAVDSGLAVIGSRSGNVLAVDIASGKRKWQRQVGAPVRQTAAIADSRVYVTAEDLRVRCLDLHSGNVLWTSAPLNGQTARDYCPIILRTEKGVMVTVCTNPVRGMGNHLARDAQLLCEKAGIRHDWRAVDEWFKSDRAQGNERLWREEQQAIVRHLRAHRDAQTFFVMDAQSGSEVGPMPVLWTGGCQGVGNLPVALPDGKLLVCYRTAYSNWVLGVAPFIGIGILDPVTVHITPLFHKHDSQPPWDTFWGTADESQSFIVAGDYVLIIHQSTLSAFHLRGRELVNLAGTRDTWGGRQSLPWARNEWHGPARSAVAVVAQSDGRIRLYWQTGSRILCLLTGASATSAQDTAIKASSVRSSSAPKLNTVHSEVLRQRLAEAVREVISRSWMPAFVQPGLSGQEMEFDHSGVTFEALSWAYPHLPTRLQASVRNYLAGLWQQHPPYTAQAWYAPQSGAPREWAPMPVALRERPDETLPHAFANVWSVMSYAKRCAEWTRVSQSWEALHQCWRSFRDTGWQLSPGGADLHANAYLASAIALQRLARRLDDPSTQREAKAFADSVGEALLAWWKRAAEWEPRPLSGVSELDGFIAKGNALFLTIRPHRAKVALFHRLTPDVANILRARAADAVRRVWGTFLRLCPTWHLVGEERQVHFGENFVDPPHFALDAFCAYAWLTGASADALARHLDIPFCRADLAAIVKIALILEAGRSAGRTMSLFTPPSSPFGKT